MVSGFWAVNLGCRGPKLKYFQSLHRQVFTFLHSPTQTLGVLFQVKHRDGSYLASASSGSMKCFECGHVGHKHITSPHYQLAAEPAVNDAAAEDE